MTPSVTDSTARARVFAALDFSRDIARLTADFIGREWLLAEVDRWLANDGPRFFLLTGEPGVGKSALAARLATVRGDITAHHFCIAGRNDTIVPAAVLRSLAAQLGQHLPGYGMALANTIKPIHLSVQVTVDVKQMSGGEVAGLVIQHLNPSDPRQELDILLRAPLAALPAPSRPLVILIDSLDEAVTYGDKNLVTLLATLDDLPPWVRFICTTRPERPVLSYFDRLKPYQLEAESQMNQDDIRQYVSYRVGQEMMQARLAQAGIEPPVLARRLLDLASGNFLYTKVLLDDIQAGHQPLTDLAALPRGLDEIYHGFLRRFGEGEWTTLYRPILGALAAAREPIREEQLVHFTGADEGAIYDGLRVVRQFMDAGADASGDETYSLFHQSLRDYLHDRKRNRDFWCSPQEAHRRVANYYLPRHAGDWAECDSYGLRHLPAHLLAAGQDGTARDLLLNFDWLQAKLAAASVGALIADYELMRKDDDAALQTWEVFLRERVHLLGEADARWPPKRVLLQLAVEHADESPATRAAEEWLARGKCDWIWLRKKSRPATVPAQAILTSVRVGEPIVDLAVDEQGLRAVVLTASLASGLTSIDHWTLAYLELQDQKVTRQEQLPASRPPPPLASLLDAAAAPHVDSLGSVQVLMLAALATQRVGYHNPELAAIARANNEALHHRGDAAALLADGRRIVTGTHDGVLRIWDLGSLEQAAREEKDDPEAREVIDQARHDWSQRQAIEQMKQIYSAELAASGQLAAPNALTWGWMNRGLQSIAFRFSSLHQLDLSERSSGRLIASWVSDVPLYEPLFDNQLLTRSSVRAVHARGGLALETSGGIAMMLTAMDGSRMIPVEALDRARDQKARA